MDPNATSKPAFSSLTIQGGALMIAWTLFGPWITAHLGINQADLTQAIKDVGELAGFAMVVIGRMRAAQPLH